jgi:hypothetical protein
MVTATSTAPWSERVAGRIRVWMGRCRVEVETSDGRRHIGVVAPDLVPSAQSCPLNLDATPASAEARRTP